MNFRGLERPRDVYASKFEVRVTSLGQQDRLLIVEGDVRTPDITLNRPGFVGDSVPGRKILTLVHAIVAGAECIDDCDVLRSGLTQRVLGHKVMAPSRVGAIAARLVEEGLPAETPVATIHAAATSAERISLWSLKTIGDVNHAAPTTFVIGEVVRHRVELKR